MLNAHGRAVRRLSDRLAAWVIAFLMPIVGCDAMHSARIVVPSPAAGVANAAGSERVLSEARAVLQEHAFVKEPATNGGLTERWSWRDSENPPGVRVTLVTSRDGVVLRIAQDLLGPVGRTEKYDALNRTLVTRLRACVGGQNVRVE
jgi:hypothetical protein